MYWLFGGSPKTIPGFLVGALIGGAVSFVLFHFDKEFAAICSVFSGMAGETLHHYMRSRLR